jgi:hypothetical protein
MATAIAAPTKDWTCPGCEKRRWSNERGDDPALCRYCEPRKQITTRAPEKPLTPEEQRQVELILTDTTRLTALEAQKVTYKAVKHAEMLLDQGKAKDPSAVARNLATVAGIATDKTLALTGRPSQIIEHRDTTEIVKALASMAPSVFAIDGTETP